MWQPPRTRGIHARVDRLTSKERWLAMTCQKTHRLSMFFIKAVLYMVWVLLLSTPQRTSPVDRYHAGMKKITCSLSKPARGSKPNQVHFNVYPCFLHNFCTLGEYAYPSL